jgi:hypothetical protein
VSGRATEFVESVFQDISGLAYGYLATAITLVSSPARGPLAISMRRRRFHSAQTAPHVALFITFVIFFLLSSRSGSELEVAVNSFIGRNAVRQDLRSVLIGALVSTALLDSVARCSLVLNERRFYTRRSRALVRVLYSILLQSIMLTIMWALILILARNIDFVGRLLRPPWGDAAIIGVVYVIVTCFSLTFLRFTKLKTRIWLRRLMQAGQTLVFGVAVVAGLLVSEWVKMLSSPTTVASIHCRVSSDGMVDAVALISNNRDEAIAIENSRVVIGLRSRYGGAWSPIYVSAAIVGCSTGAASEPYCVFQPGSTGWLHVRGGPSTRVSGATTQIADDFTDCTFSDDWTRLLGEPEVNYVDVLTEPSSEQNGVNDVPQRR